jgi:hypothetical protein
MVESRTIGRRFELLEGFLDERLRRCVAAAEAEAIGRGGISVVSRATGVSRRAIRVGIAELKTPKRKRLMGRVRKPGGGRKRTVDKDPKLLVDLEKLNRRRVEIPRRRCAGHARACACWPVS